MFISKCMGAGFYSDLYRLEITYISGHWEPNRLHVTAKAEVKQDSVRPRLGWPASLARPLSWHHFLDSMLPISSKTLKG